MNKKANVWVLAIVGVVALVAVVVLFQGSGSATGYAPLSPVNMTSGRTSTSDCKMFKFMPAETTLPYDTDFTGHQLCKRDEVRRTGYTKCLLSQETSLITYYDTADGTCGNVQLMLRSSGIRDCDARVRISEARCQRSTGDTSRFVEPIIGDGNVLKSVSVMCCK